MTNAVERLSSRGKRAAGAVLTGAFVLIGVFGAQAQTTPDMENGRYTLSPVTDGVVRLDTRTGVVSACTDKGSGWACYVVPDERTALDAEIDRLQKDNDALKAELAARGPVIAGKTGEAMPKTDSLKPKVSEGERKIEIPLPSDRDLDRMMTFVENAWRRLVDIASRIQSDPSGKI